MTAYKTAAVGFGSGMLGALVMMAASGAAPKAKPVKVPDVIEAKEFRLVDGQGKTLGVWFGTDGAPQFTLYASGKPRVVLSADDSTAGVVVGNPKAANVMMFITPDGRAVISADNAGGVINIGPTKEGVPVVEIADAAGRVKFQAGR